VDIDEIACLLDEVESGDNLSGGSKKLP